MYFSFFFIIISSNVIIQLDFLGLFQHIWVDGSGLFIQRKLLTRHESKRSFHKDEASDKFEDKCSTKHDNSVQRSEI